MPKNIDLAYKDILEEIKENKSFKKMLKEKAFRIVKMKYVIKNKKSA